jgi:hypothetical protein
MMPIPRKHHFVQQAHLDGFTNPNGMLFVASKNGAPFSSRPLGVFAVRDLYSYNTMQGVRADFELELARLENDTFPFIREIADKSSISPQGAEALRLYMACSILRNPIYQHTVIESERLSVMTAAELVDRNGGVPAFPRVGSELDDRTLTDLIRSGEIEIEVSNIRYLQALQKQLSNVVQLLGLFHLRVIASDGDDFAIGDHPFTFLHPGQDFGFYGTPLGGPGCELTFPVSKHVCVVGRWGDALPGGNEKWIQQANLRQAMFASLHLASANQSEALMRAMWKYTGLSFKGDVARIPTSGGYVVVARRALLPTARRRAAAVDVRAFSEL